MENENFIKLLIWVVMDGTIVDYSKYEKKSTKIRIQFKLSKQRKIKELTSLLNKLNYKYTINKATLSKFNKLQPYVICIYSDYARNIYKKLNKKKEFPNWFKNFNKKQTLTLLKTISITDGTIQNRRLIWVTKNKTNSSIVKYLCNKHNIVFEENGKEQSGFNKNIYNPRYLIRLPNEFFNK